MSANSSPGVGHATESDVPDGVPTAPTPGRVLFSSASVGDGTGGGRFSAASPEAAVTQERGKRYILRPQTTGGWPKGGFVVNPSNRHVIIIFCHVGEGIHKNGVAPAMFHLERNERQNTLAWDT